MERETFNFFRHFRLWEQEKFVINCPKRETYVKFIEYLDENDFRWSSGESLVKRQLWYPDSAYRCRKGTKEVSYSSDMTYYESHMHLPILIMNDFK